MKHRSPSHRAKIARKRERRRAVAMQSQWMPLDFYPLSEGLPEFTHQVEELARAVRDCWMQFGDWIERLQASAQARTDAR